jgi:glycosyltransferase involved in cell wall biosynthesis
MKIEAAQVPELSVVVPMFREEMNVVKAVALIDEQLKEVAESYELIIVDDGSPDRTWDRIREATKCYPCLRAIRLSRNFGKEHAVCAGLELSRGRAVLVMDGDLQHPPALIPTMVNCWRRGEAEVVEAVKRHRGRESWIHKVAAGFFYRSLKSLSGFDLRGASDFKLLDRKVLSAWLQMRERNLFFRGMIEWLGFRRERISFEVADRAGGHSQWSLFALVRLAMTAITAFSSALLQLVTLFGFLFLVFAFAFGVFALYMKVSGRALTGFTTVILLLLLVGSLLMISLGLIGLYLARIYDEVKGRPRFVVAESLHDSSRDQSDVFASSGVVPASSEADLMRNRAVPT